ncbi:PBSX family phage terminase large subunit [Paenibacillus macquariensis]|uniref:Phage terminase large subunit n=1 Tax=Paenibacillus macquariensis TaxID=948756 RepID=A0ABY1JX58_9BACL|nr:PBSX family phage terminase large subunit [Paenibacillus macquariensis]MEC0089345.1 PBSX family phage terminase large subunit [Paenibacillus macquariensis]OAB33255.1 terminase [Paenibacillus macquariensis subsp. macquariensis]SIQ93347.1 phage terminase large subunit [Paenibacillus macquariensis]
MSSKEISLQDTVGKGYADFWRYEGRYRVVKGGRGSKKSVTTALWIVYNMMKMPLSNTLVLRKTFNAHKDSTFTQLKWAANRLKVSHLWHFKKSPLEAIYKPTGQMILFRGLDDPMSITSITVENGYLCWAWFEEAYQLMNEDDFDKVDMSIRGELPEGYFKQLTLSFNPWNEKHWLKKRFFDVPNDNVMAITTNYRCNEFLGDDDRALFEWMKKHKPKRHKVEGDGDWGIAEGAVYEDWREEDFDYRAIAKMKGYKAVFGLDFGYTNDPSALVCALVNKEEKKLYIFDEHYEHGMKNDDIAAMIKRKEYAKERIIADSSEPKSIDEIRGHGIGRIRAADKGPDSVKAGIQFIQQFEIIVHKFNCPNIAIELSGYVWDQNKAGKFLNRPVDDFNHTLDALRYAMEQIRKPDAISFD